MKKFLFLFFVFIFSFAGCSSTHESNNNINIESIENAFTKHLYSEIGYCDVSEYYVLNYFSQLPAFVGCRIITSNDSTNFDEYGIFEFQTQSEAKKSVNILKNYLSKSKAEFQGGIVYNVNEYPKFENATVKRFDKYVVYTILSPEKSKLIFDEIYSIKKEL